MDVATIVNYGTIAGWILAGLNWVGQRLTPSAKTNPVRAWLTSPNLTGILILLGLSLSSLQWYLHRDYNHLKYDPAAPLEQITDKVFTNQTVEIDGKDYRYCHFRNVTFMFHGRSRFALEHNGFGGIILNSDNPTVLSAWALAKAMGFLPGIPILGPDGRPDSSIQEPNPLPPKPNPSTQLE
jgi:hypothetical protein